MPSVLVVVAFAGVAVAQDRDPNVLAAQAHEALTVAGDTARAIDLAGDALKIEPDHVDALFVRGMAYLVAAENAGADALVHELNTKLGRTDLQRVIALAPGSKSAAIADQFLNPQFRWSPETPCHDPVGHKRFSEAEVAFSSGNSKLARKRYEQALDACPDAAVFATYLGDAWWQQGNVAKALASYERAIAIDRCEVLAHAYEADVLAQVGRYEESVPHVYAAIACNPTYQQAWAMLAQVPVGVLSAPIEPRSQPRPTELVVAGADASAGQRAWSAWSAVHFDQGGETDVIARERAAAHAGVLAYGPVAPDAHDFWSAIARADAAGQLDAAMYVLLLDDHLVPTFATWRVAHHDEAVAFLKSAVALP